MKLVMVVILVLFSLWVNGGMLVGCGLLGVVGVKLLCRIVCIVFCGVGSFMLVLLVSVG